MNQPVRIHNKKSRYRFPWREGNRFELLVDGGRFYPAMLGAIASARRYILLEMYLAESGSVADAFINAFCAAAERGVEVSIILDHLGARGLARIDRERLERAGCRIAYYNPLRLGKWLHNFVRDHRKLLLVDGEVGFVGGAGITDDFDPQASGEKRWRETVVRIQGPVLADWQTLFAETWARCEADHVKLPSAAPRFHQPGMRGCVTPSHGIVEQDVTRMLVNYLYSAQQRVWLSTAYFVPTRRIRRALRHAARRGVDVRLLLASPYTDHPSVRHAGRRFYGRLLHQGVRIFEFPNRVLHAKAVLCDDWSSIGSTNFDHWTLRWNLEANQAVLNGDFAGEVAAMFQRDFDLSMEITHADWLNRSWRSRALEWWWGKIDQMLHRFGQR